MSIQFLLRKYMKESLYRKALSNLVNMDGNVLILSTGYIHNSKSSNNRAITEFAKEIDNRNLRAASSLTIVIVGGETDTKSSYPNNFIDFCNELYKNIKDKSKIKIIFKRVLGDNWHGKVAIKIEENTSDFSNNKYYGALVGSSNLTPINILDGQFGWNKETDLYIVDGNLVKDSKLNKVKELECSVKVCDQEIISNIKKINISIKTINTEIKTIELENIDRDDKAYLKQLEKLKNICKEYLSSNKNEESQYLFSSILQSIGDIMNLNRINSEIHKSFEDLRQPGNGLYQKANNLKEVYPEIYNRYEDILNITKELFKEKETCTFDDFDSLYSQIKEFQKYFNDLTENNKERIVVEFSKSIELFKGAVNTIRKNLLVFKTAYDLKTDGAYIESILKGIHIEIRDIIDNFTIDKLSL